MKISAFSKELNTVFYSLGSKKISAPLRLALITDLHACAYGKGQRELIDAVIAQSPHFVLLGGDIFDKDFPKENALLLCRALAARYPCYFVTGNHETGSGRYEEYYATLADCGVRALRDASVTVEFGAQQIQLCGIADPGKFHLSKAWIDSCFVPRLTSLRAACNPALFTILLIHRPDLFIRCDNQDFDLVLSGHTHGGQWRIPGLLNGLTAPGQGLFPRYAGGFYGFQNGSALIVSRGLARETTHVPRIYNRPELVIVDLLPFV